MNTARPPVSYEVSWSEEDQEWVATTAQYPSLSWLGDSPIAALDGLMHLLFIQVIRS